MKRPNPSKYPRNEWTQLIVNMGCYIDYVLKKNESLHHCSDLLLKAIESTDQESFAKCIDDLKVYSKEEKVSPKID